MEDLSVRCLVVPLKGLLLLLPNTLVAEVTDYTEPSSLPNAPEWLRGMMAWRGRSIPVMDILSVAGRGKDSQKAKRAVVLNTLNGNAELPFIAISAHGIPRLVEVNGDMIQPVKEEDGAAVNGVACRVLLADHQVVIPDVDAIERMLGRLSVKAG